jgi:RNA polymerase sigma-70 factor (ECF subfamily)
LPTETRDPTASASLEELMVQYVDGNATAFEALYRRISPRLLGYLIRLTRDRDRAEDLMQITFSKVHRARSSYLRGAPLLPWVMAIARRSFLDERRSARARREDVTRSGEVPEPVPSAGGLPVDLAEALERALNRLPPAQREALELTKEAGLSIGEAAQVLNATPTAVKLRVHRGYQLLRRELEAYSRKS